MKTNKKKEDIYITTHVENREKIYKIANDIFKDSIDDIEKSDKKIHYYLVILNIFIFIFINFIMKYLGLKPDQNNLLNINLIQFIVIIDIIIIIILFFLSFYLCLSSLRQRIIYSHPTIQDFNKLLQITDKGFWHELYKYYFSKAEENKTQINKKKKIIRKVENLLLIITSFVLILVFLLFCSSYSNLSSFLIKIK